MIQKMNRLVEMQTPNVTHSEKQRCGLGEESSIRYDILYLEKLPPFYDHAKNHIREFIMITTIQKLQILSYPLHGLGYQRFTKNGVFFLVTPPPAPPRTFSKTMPRTCLFKMFYKIWPGLIKNSCVCGGGGGPC